MDPTRRPSTVQASWKICERMETAGDADGADTCSPMILLSPVTCLPCSEGFFQCNSGECIYDDQVCSGGAECKDGSDETNALCANHFCSETGLRCNYGACVARMASCDGKMDCIDGSDEFDCGHWSAGMLPVAPVTDDPTSPSSDDDSDVESVLNELRDFLNEEMEIKKLREKNLKLRLKLLGILLSDAGSHLGLSPLRVSSDAVEGVDSAESQEEAEGEYKLALKYNPKKGK